VVRLSVGLFEERLSPCEVILSVCGVRLSESEVRLSGTSFQFFLEGEGGKILTVFLGGGQNMKKKPLCMQKHKKSLLFKFRGATPHPLPHQMTSLKIFGV